MLRRVKQYLLVQMSFVDLSKMWKQEKTYLVTVYYPFPFIKNCYQIYSTMIQILMGKVDHITQKKQILKPVLVSVE